MDAFMCHIYSNMFVDRTVLKFLNVMNFIRLINFCLFKVVDAAFRVLLAALAAVGTSATECVHVM